MISNATTIRRRSLYQLIARSTCEPFALVANLCKMLPPTASTVKTHPLAFNDVRNTSKSMRNSKSKKKKKEKKRSKRWHKLDSTKVVAAAAAASLGVKKQYHK